MIKVGKIKCTDCRYDGCDARFVFYKNNMTLCRFCRVKRGWFNPNYIRNGRKSKKQPGSDTSGAVNS